MTALEVGVGILAVWRLSHLLQAEDGPWELLVRLRRLAGSGQVAKMLDCFYCLSVWVAVPFALWAGDRRLEVLVLWPALSGGAILLERVTTRGEPLELPWFAEDPESSDGRDDELELRP